MDMSLNRMMYREEIERIRRRIPLITRGHPNNLPIMSRWMSQNSGHFSDVTIATIYYYLTHFKDDPR